MEIGMVSCIDTIAGLGALLILASPLPASAQAPDAIAAPGKIQILKAHAVGAQIYECKMDKNGKLAWQFREPIAALIFDGKTIGRHYAGPTWELTDGSVVTGKVTGSAAGATSKDIKWLRLDAIAHRGSGQLSDATTVQRLDTSGGVADSDCTAAGDFLGVPYASEYVFLK
jgi:hypothetical protein